MLGIKIKLYSSKYFIQNNPEVKNNLYHLFLQESPAKDGLLPFKFLKTLNLSYRDTGYLPLLMRSCFPATAPRSFCLIRYSILIGCFNKTFCSVKYTVLRQKPRQVGTFSFLALCYKGKSNIWKQILYDVLYNVLKQTTEKILIYTVETRLCYSCF